MAIPVAATMRASEESPFDRLLRDSVANEANDDNSVPQPQRDDAPVDAELDDVDADTPEARDVTETDEQDANAEVGDDAGDEAPVDLEDDVTESVERAETDQPKANGNVAKETGRSQPVTSEPLIAATLQNQVNQQQLQTATQNAGQQAANAKPAQATLTGSASAATTNNGPPKAANVQAAYSTRSAAQAQMLEQARDSVFKQIMMKLNADGGEVRMRLEPPDLGQLDLRMTVEGGNKLSLTIAADRGDINSLLQRHLDELKQTLQQSGLEITDAEVQTRKEFDQQRTQHEAHEGSSSADDTTNQDAETAPQSQQYITAGGLNFLA